MTITPRTRIDAGTVWVVEVESGSDGRHVHGVYASESRAHDAVVELMTTRFAGYWSACSVRMPAPAEFDTTGAWHRAVLAAWTLVAAPDVTIAWEDWQPQ